MNLLLFCLQIRNSISVVILTLMDKKLTIGHRSSIVNNSNKYSNGILYIFNNNNNNNKGYAGMNI